MKFKAGDHFKVIDSGLRGQVVGISFNSILQENEYIVLWEGKTQEEGYAVGDCDPIWEFVMDSTIMVRLPKAVDFIFANVNIDTTGPVTVQCNGHHTWIDVGFHWTKEVCKYCDAEKKA